MTDQNYQPTLTQLKAFVAVARHQHFSSAAQDLGVSQPTLSQALSFLESGIGVQLIERSTRRVFITEAGNALLPHAENVLDAANTFVSSAARVSTGAFASQLHIGIIPTIAPYLLPGLLPRITQDSLSLSVSILEDQTNRLLQSMRIGSIDVGVVALEVELLPSNIISYPLFTEEFVLATPLGHPFAGRKDLTIEDLRDQSVLLLEEGHCMREQAIDICRMANAHRIPQFGDTKASSLSTILQCVAAGLGVTLIPAIAVEVETARTNLGVAYFKDQVLTRTVGLIYRSSSVKATNYRNLGAMIVNSVQDKIVQPLNEDASIPDNG